MPSCGGQRPIGRLPPLVPYRARLPRVAASRSSRARRRPLARRYTRSMTTTIKVSDELRDRLKEQAARDRLTLGSHLAHLADAEDRRWCLPTLNSALDSSRSEAARSPRRSEEPW